MYVQILLTLILITSSTCYAQNPAERAYVLRQRQGAAIQAESRVRRARLKHHKIAVAKNEIENKRLEAIAEAQIDSVKRHEEEKRLEQERTIPRYLYTGVDPLENRRSRWSSLDGRFTLIGWQAFALYRDKVYFSHYPNRSPAKSIPMKLLSKDDQKYIIRRLELMALPNSPFEDTELVFPKG